MTHICLVIPASRWAVPLHVAAARAEVCTACGMTSPVIIRSETADLTVLVCNI